MGSGLRKSGDFRYVVGAAVFLIGQTLHGVGVFAFQPLYDLVGLWCVEGLIPGDELGFFRFADLVESSVVEEW